MCTAFLTAATRDWNGGAQLGMAGMENKWKKNHSELNKVIQRVSVTELNQQPG